MNGQNLVIMKPIKPTVVCLAILRVRLQQLTWRNHILRRSYPLYHPKWANLKIKAHKRRKYLCHSTSKSLLQRMKRLNTQDNLFETKPKWSFQIFYFPKIWQKLTNPVSIFVKILFSNTGNINFYFLIILGR